MRTAQAKFELPLTCSILTLDVILLIHSLEMKHMNTTSLALGLLLTACAEKKLEEVID